MTKKIFLAVAAFIAFIPARTALAAPIWTIVYKDWEPGQKIFRHTNFDVSAIVRNGDQVFASTMNNSSRNSRGGSVHTTRTNCKEKTISTAGNSKYFRRNKGEWWAEVYLDKSPRFSWYATGIYSGKPKIIAGMKQSVLNSDKRYEAMFNFLCSWK